MELFRDEEWSGYLIESCHPLGLPSIVFTYPARYLEIDVPQHLRVPSILVSNRLDDVIIWSDDNFMVSITEHPIILDGQCKLSPSELALVCRWVSINQVVLMVHYEGGTDTCDLYDDLKPLVVLNR